MQALVLHRHGGLDELVLERTWPDPQAGAGGVVIAVKACGLNYHDVFTVRGMPGIKVPLPVVPGIDMSGEIVGVGANVSGWRVGDRVLIDPFDRNRGKLLGEMLDGGLAEYCAVDASTLIKLPDDVTYVDAAALPVAYGTAYRMMSHRGAIRAGEKVLILGASGGVGTGCVQLARAAGAYVIAAGSGRDKLEALTRIGADEVVDYRERDFMEVIHERHGKPRVWAGGGVDVVVNFTGGDTWVPSLRSLRRGGRILTCGATAGYDPATDLRFIWTFELNVMGSNGWERDDITALLAMVQAGTLTPVIDRAVPLTEAVDGLRSLEDRSVIGKVIIEPGK